MIVETEPSGLMMIRYKFYFNQQSPDPEDAWVLAEYFRSTPGATSGNSTTSTRHAV